jgi:hypothetical protein
VKCGENGMVIIIKMNKKRSNNKQARPNTFNPSNAQRQQSPQYRESARELLDRRAEYRERQDRVKDPADG